MAQWDSYSQLLNADIATGDELGIWDTSVSQFKNVTVNELGTHIGANYAVTSFDALTGKPTTISGYGITDAYTKTEADGKYLLNTTDTFTGDLSATGSVYAGGTDVRIGTDGIYFEADKHAITFNDGFGNFNLRVGNNGIVDENSTEDGYLTHLVYSQTTGLWQWQISSASVTAGAAPTWRSQLEIDADDVSLGYQGAEKLVTTSAGVTITGTATATTFAGNATTATTATNQSGGTVSATTATFSGLITGKTCTSTTVAAANDLGSISCRGDASYPAVMSFHRSAAYAVNFGLSTSNVMELGGWSAVSIMHSWDMSGNYTAVGNVTAYSDIRLKDNIEVIPDAVAKVQQLRGVTFDRNDFEPDAETGVMPDTRQSGVIAQEVLEVLPEVVSEMKDGTLTVAYGNMVGLLIEAIKEQQQQIDELKERLNGVAS